MAKRPCSICGTLRAVTPKSRTRVVCHECRRSLSHGEKVALGIVKPNATKDYTYKKSPCEICGVLRFLTVKGVAADGRQLCRQCRSTVGSARPDSYSSKADFVAVSCEWCGAERMFAPSEAKGRRFCSRICMNEMRRSRWGDNSKHRRADREREAEGLRWRDRKALLRKWKKQRRVCHYACGRAADTIDHLIPLVRGGTNYEGNLVPCCKPCNSSKQDKLPIEFRLNRPASSTYMPIRYRARVTRPAKARALRVCIVCDLGFPTDGTRRKTCGDPVCSREWTNRTTRDNYRRRVGIPVDINEPTRYWKRFAA